MVSILLVTLLGVHALIGTLVALPFVLRGAGALDTGESMSSGHSYKAVGWNRHGDQLAFLITPSSIRRLHQPL